MTTTDTKDTLQKFIFDNAAVRGELVEISDTWREIQARHGYPKAGVRRSRAGAAGDRQPAAERA